MSTDEARAKVRAAAETVLAALKPMRSGQAKDAFQDLDGALKREAGTLRALELCKSHLPDLADLVAQATALRGRFGETLKAVNEAYGPAPEVPLAKEGEPGHRAYYPALPSELGETHRRIRDLADSLQGLKAEIESWSDRRDALAYLICSLKWAADEAGLDAGALVAP